MAKKKNFLAILSGVVAVIVSLAIGNALIRGQLYLPWITGNVAGNIIEDKVSIWSGWLLIGLTLLGVIGLFVNLPKFLKNK